MTDSDAAWSGRHTARVAYVGEGSAWFPGSASGAGLATAATVLAAAPAFLIGPLAFDMRRSFPISESDVGSGIALFFLASAVVSYSSGRLADGVDPKRGMMIGLGVSTLACAILGFVSVGVVGLLATCPLMGVSNGLIQPNANVLIFRSVTPGSQGFAISFKQAAVPSATLVSGIGVVIIASGTGTWQSAYRLLMVLCLLALAFMTVTGVRPHFRTTLGLSGATARRSGWRGHARGPERVGDSDFRLLAIGTAFGGASASVLGPFIVDGLVRDGISVGFAGKILLVGSGVSIATRIGLGRLSDWRGGWPEHLRVVALSMTLGAVALCMVAYGPENKWVALLVVMVAFGAGWGWPGLLQFGVLERHHARPGVATGRIQSATYVGAVIGPWVFGLISESYSYGSAWLITAAVAAIGGWIIWRSTRGAQSRDAATPAQGAGSLGRGNGGK